MKEYFAEVLLTKEEYKRIKGYLEPSCENEYQGVGNTISKTVVFPNGIEMDIKCCGCDSESSWTEAVLFLNGSECCCTEPGYEFLGEWVLEYKGISYHAFVQVASK